jgi:polyphosphate kinase
MPIQLPTVEQSYFDRDLSWLSFNERVLLEAAKETVPLLERINFLSIYSSNLDEFYRVRIPALMALQKIKKNKDYAARVLEQATQRVHLQQELFGQVLTRQIIPALKEDGIHLIYNEAIPEIIKPAVLDFFFSRLLAFLQPIDLSETGSSFFPENNKLYIAAIFEQDDQAKTVILNIPSGSMARFFLAEAGATRYVIFIDDIIREHLPLLYPGAQIDGAYSFKITRDSELDLQDEYEGDIAEKIEKQIAKRDLGFATRFLHSPSMPDHLLQSLIEAFSLSNASIMKGGTYHNLKDLASFPIKESRLSYPKWNTIKKTIPFPLSLLDSIMTHDLILHTPYQDYNLVLRFFNEAALDKDVEEIYVTMYRIAGDSHIGHALISAARNGKNVTVFVELKARFDEANNIRWAKKMKEAGVKIIYSIPGLKVHAKVALVKKRKGNRTLYYGLLATGNFNESTARFYTDHILMTANKEMLRELELLFIYLAKRKKPETSGDIEFNHLLIAQFNLQQRFLQLIDREIEAARKGQPARIVIKLNNLEEEVLIDKLYEASQAGVSINLLVRSICRIIPGVKGLSDNISVKRIVDRYLEHGRIFWFHHNGRDEIYAGSADWMNRNIYRRIEVCFPVYDEQVKNELKEILSLQLADTVQAVWIDPALNNQPFANVDKPTRSQEAIWQLLNNHE